MVENANEPRGTTRESIIEHKQQTDGHLGARAAETLIAHEPGRQMAQLSTIFSHDWADKAYLHYT